MICKLKEICSYRTEKINVDEIKKDDYISTDNLLPNFAGIGELKSFPTCGNVNKYCKGDILISNIRPYFKKMIYSNKLSGCSTDVLVIKSDEEKVNSKYLYYSLMCDNFFDYVMLTSKGTKMPRGDKNSIMNYEVMVPIIENQNKIVDILDSLNSKIKLNNEINNNLHELANNILLNDLDQDDLEEFRLDELFYQITPGTNYQPERVESGIPFLNVKNINNGYIDFSDSKYISPDDYEKVHKTWQPEVNDLLISRIGTLGLVAVIREEDLPLAVHYNFLDFKTNKIPFEFCYFMFKSKYFQDKYRFNVKNSVQEYVTVDDIRKIEIKIPSSEAMEKYKSFYNKILNIQRENKVLSQIRDTLLPKLMNGEIDLDNIEI